MLFSLAKCQNDYIWDFFTKISLNLIPNLPENLLCQLIDSFCQSYRGSNEFWKILLKRINTSDIKLDSKIIGLKSIIQLELNEKDYENSFRKKIFRNELIKVKIIYFNILDTFASFFLSKLSLYYKQP